MNTKQSELPRLADDADYCTANAKLTCLKLDLIEAEKKREAVLTNLNTPRLRSNPIQEAALKMLEGDSTPLPAAITKELLESYQELGTRITVIRTAIKMQEKIVTELRAAASHRAMKLAQPIHHENVRNVVAKLKALDEALAAESDLRESLFLRDFFVSVHPMGLRHLGLLRDDSSRASRYLLEAHREGFISLSELPENLQKMVPSPPGTKKPVFKAVKAKFDDWTATA